MGAQRWDRDCRVASGSHKGGKRALIWERRRNRCAGIEEQTCHGCEDRGADVRGGVGVDVPGEREGQAGERVRKAITIGAEAIC